MGAGQVPLAPRQRSILRGCSRGGLQRCAQVRHPRGRPAGSREHAASGRQGVFLDCAGGSRQPHRPFGRGHERGGRPARVGRGRRVREARSGERRCKPRGRCPGRGRGRTGPPHRVRLRAGTALCGARRCGCWGEGAHGRRPGPRQGRAAGLSALERVWLPPSVHPGWPMKTVSALPAGAVRVAGYDKPVLARRRRPARHAAAHASARPHARARCQRSPVSCPSPVGRRPSSRWPTSCRRG
mmetsp:Transcript_19937/g.76469  ORF Transcript_19937/g.76469 Transcript_19937/m.76469 type:complete len:241 (-) Transcript_19937:611-1333(-)